MAPQALFLDEAREVLVGNDGYHEQGVRSAGAGENGGDPAACNHSPRAFFSLARIAAINVV